MRPESVRRSLLGILLLLGLAIALSWALFRLVSSRAAAHASRILPASTAVYIESPDVGAVLEAIRATPLPTAFSGWQAHPLARWLLPRHQAGASGAWREKDGGLCWAVALAGKESVEEAIASLTGSGTPVAVPQASYRGDPYVLIQLAGSAPAGAGRVGRYLVLASDERCYRRLLESAAGGSSLERSAGLRRARRRLEAGEGLFGYLALETAQAGGSGAPSHPVGLQGLAFHSRPGPQGWAERFYLLPAPEQAPLMRELLGLSPCEPDLGEWFPEDSTLLVSACAGGLTGLYNEALDEILSRMRPELAATLRERLAGVEQLTGLNIERDVLPTVGRRLALALGWDGSPRSLASLPGLVLALDVERPREFAPILGRVTGFGRATGRLLREERDGQELFTLNVDRKASGPGARPEPGPAPSYTLAGSRLLVAGSPERLRQALAAGRSGRTLAALEELRAMRRLAPAEVHLLAILGRSAARAWLEPGAQGSAGGAREPQGAGPGPSISELRPALLWAVARRDGVAGEVHASSSLLLQLATARLRAGADAARAPSQNP